GYAHGQIALGFDRLRQSLWLRDPQDRRTNEAPVKTLLKRYVATGPRGLALVPRSRAELLDVPSYVDVPAYDALFRVQSALARSDRSAAAGAFAAMQAAAPGHRLTIMAQIALARYDANPSLLLDALGAALE